MGKFEKPTWCRIAYLSLYKAALALASECRHGSDFLSTFTLQNKQENFEKNNLHDSLRKHNFDPFGILNQSTVTKTNILCSYIKV